MRYVYGIEFRKRILLYFGKMMTNAIVPDGIPFGLAYPYRR